MALSLDRLNTKLLMTNNSNFLAGAQTHEDETKIE